MAIPETMSKPGQRNEDIKDVITIDSDTDALMSFAIDQRAIVEAETAKIEYPDFQYDQLIFIDYGQDEWADKVVRRIKDVRGSMKWGAPQNNDIPRVGVNYTMKAYDVYKREMGIQYTKEELIRASKSGVNLSSDKDEGAREISQQDLNVIALFGNVQKGMEGYFTSSLVPRVTATSSVRTVCEAVTLTGGIQEAINFFWAPMQQVTLNQTKTIYRAQGIALSESDYGWLKSTHVPASSMTLLQFLENNLNILFVPVWALDHTLMPAADDPTIEHIGLPNDIMMVFRYDRRCCRFHLPMPFNFGPTYMERGGAVVKQDGMYRTGGTEFRIPNAFLYVDLPDYVPPTKAAATYLGDDSLSSEVTVTKNADGEWVFPENHAWFDEFDPEQNAFKMQAVLLADDEGSEGGTN